MGKIRGAQEVLEDVGLEFRREGKEAGGGRRCHLGL